MSDDYDLVHEVRQFLNGEIDDEDRAALSIRTLQALVQEIAKRESELDAIREQIRLYKERENTNMDALHAIIEIVSEHGDRPGELRSTSNASL